jgi:hypothetical protein
MNDCPFAWSQTYVLCGHGFPSQHPVAVDELNVLKACRVPAGEHVAEHFPFTQFGVPPEHVLPHAPQLESSVRTLAHEPLQYS